LHMRCFLFGLFIMTLSGSLCAQMPGLRLEHLTTRDGMPSNDVWCITKDRQGFLWIGTGRSICRYDGYTFRTVSDATLGYSSGISADSTGSIYASISTKGLCLINPGTLAVQTILANNYNDKDLTNNMHERVFVDSFNQVWVCDYTAVKRYDPARRKRRVYALSSAENRHQDATFFEDRQHRLWVISEIGLYAYDRQADRLTCVLGQEARQPERRKPVRLEIASQDAQGTIWIGAYDGGILRFQPDDLSYVFMPKGFENQHVICVQESVDENGRKLLLVGTEKGISLFYPDKNEVYHLPDFYNKGIHVRAMYDDKDNGILWIGTREGVFKYRYRNPGIQTVDIPGNAVNLPVEVTSPLQLPNGNYMLGLSHTGALLWQPATNRFSLRAYPRDAYTYRLRWIHNRPVAFTDKGVFAGGATTGNFSVLPVASRLFTATEFRDGLLDRRGRFWLANHTEGLKVVDPTTNSQIRLWPDSVGQQLSQNNYVKAIEEAADGKIWVATCPNGLYYFDESRARFVNINDLPINKGKSLSGMCVNALQRGQNGSMLIATWGGVNKISAEGRILVAFDYERDKLYDTYCTNVCEDKQGTIWFSTNEGIHIANPSTRALKYLTTIEGLRSNYPVGFLKNTADELIVGHINGINVLNLSVLSKTKTVPRLAISSIDIKGKPLDQPLNETIELQPDNNQLTLNFSTLNFEPPTRNQYKYQLEGFDTTWIRLGSQHTLSFTNLPPNTYRLNLKSGNNAGNWQDRALQLTIHVKPHFTATWWFRILSGLLLAGVVMGLVRWRVNTLAERNQLDLQISELKLRALQSQMNPHFLFNSLNSVQNYLLTDRGIEGVRYLSKFSKLVRRILENSSHQYLRFEQIIETLRMYIEIESFRFNHEFSYSFDIASDDVLMDAMLPPMLLQPYVENAIWHGLMPKEGEKRLFISAYIKQEHIVCIIQDNGVGRRLTPRKEGHISRGQEMTKGIFDSLRRKDSLARLEIIDLFDAENTPVGTRVEMNIPIKKS
jgi:ligand-binding sensor domain-containing protein